MLYDGNAGNVCTIGLTFAVHAPDCNAFGTGAVATVPDAGVPAVPVVVSDAALSGG